MNSDRKRVEFINYRSKSTVFPQLSFLALSFVYLNFLIREIGFEDMGERAESGRKRMKTRNEKSAWRNGESIKEWNSRERSNKSKMLEKKLGKNIE